MPIDVNSTAYLLGAYGVIDRPKPFLTNLFFGTEYNFDTEEVYFDRVTRARRLAPFVSPLVAGKAQRHRGYQTVSFKPAYVKPKHSLTPGRALKRIAGEMLLGNLSPEQRLERTKLDLLQIQDDEITRTEEWMATQMLLTGSVAISGELFAPMVVDMGRNALNTIALTGAARWGQAGVDPYENIKTWGAGVQDRAGYHPSTVIMDPVAAGLFVNTSATVGKVMNTYRQTSGNINLAGVTAGGGIGEEVKYLGETGEYQFWVYQQIYMDELGNKQKFMPDNTVIMGSAVGAEGSMLYGAIQDLEALRPLKRFPKIWDEKDPSVRYMMTQSAPIVALGWPDATLSATVN